MLSNVATATRVFRGSLLGLLEYLTHKISSSIFKFLTCRMLILRVQRAQKEQRKQRQQREQRQQQQPREVEECQKRYFVLNTFNVVRCYLCCSSMLKSKNRTHLSLPPLQNPDPSAFKEMDHTEPCSCTSNSCNTSPLATLTNTRRPSLVPEERLKDG